MQSKRLCMLTGWSLLPLLVRVAPGDRLLRLCCSCQCPPWHSPPRRSYSGTPQTPTGSAASAVQYCMHRYRCSVHRILCRQAGPAPAQAWMRTNRYGSASTSHMAELKLLTLHLPLSIPAPRTLSLLPTAQNIQANVDVGSHPAVEKGAGRRPCAAGLRLLHLVLL